MLAEKPSEHYRPGEWNRLKVRVEKDKLRVLRQRRAGDRIDRRRLHDGPRRAGQVPQHGGRVPAVRRGQRAASEQARTAKPWPDSRRRSTSCRRWPRRRSTTLTAFAADRPQRPRRRCWRGPASWRRGPRELTLLAADVRTAGRAGGIRASSPGRRSEKIDLLRAALTIARLDEDDLDVEAYVKHVERMAGEIQQEAARRRDRAAEARRAERVPVQATTAFTAAAPTTTTGPTAIVSRVIDDREGLPITLSVLYMELAARLGVKIEGVGLPAHFVVRHVPAEGRAAADRRVRRRHAADAARRPRRRFCELTGEPAIDEHFRGGRRRGRSCSGCCRT